MENITAEDLSNKDAINQRQLDVWAIYRDPEHVLDALQIVAEHKDQITQDNPLNLFVNCYSKLEIGGKQLGRYMDTLVCSNEADIALMLSSARYVDSELGGISATPLDIVKYFDKKEIPYQIVTGKEQDYKEDDRQIPELWFAREEFVLEDALKDSGCNKCTISNEKGHLSMGYYSEDGKYNEIWGLNIKGIVKTDTNWTLIIDEGYKDNLSLSQVEDLVKNQGFSYTIEEKDNNVKHER